MMKVLGFAALLAAAPLVAQSTYELTMTYDRPGLTVPHWTLTIPAAGPATYTGKPEQGIDPGTVAVALSNAGRDKLGALLERTHNLQPCETRTKGIANMGAKELTYSPAGKPAVHCAFNYTDNKPLSEASEYLAGIANTVQFGLELDRLHRYDRLGLDAVLARLQNEVKEHRAVELIAIRASLESLTRDDALMDRVRSRAQMLLDLADASK